ncbi:hypothetical protein PFBG_03179 [Plasmodium falciparum 7G8]|uniref:Uncharacterized protein n=2 Tax=Plasmodium falciparum TaxID=5833 RepID=W7F6J9_PLAF8|nr:hypothetical protein PFNF135_03252 [Plasmodium falciparum NF135/5.C10]EUR70950.1 hypothetical protein PFBG_03179 [Plasmodium falciparum 7G8]
MKKMNINNFNRLLQVQKWYYRFECNKIIRLSIWRVKKVVPFSDFIVVIRTKKENYILSHLNFFA